MALIGTLNSFTPSTTIVSADVNSNFSAVKTAFNDTAVLTDVARTIAATHTFSVLQKFGDGTAGAPILTFTSDTDTGLYRIGANNIGIATNGGKRFDVSATGATVTGTLAVTGASTLTGDVTASGLVGVGRAPLTGCQIVAGPGPLASFTTVPDNRVQLTSQTATHELAYVLYVDEGTKNNRAKFYLDDDVGEFGIWAQAASGALPFKIKWGSSSTFMTLAATTGNANFLGTMQWAGGAVLTSSSVVVTLTGTQTLTNKTLTAPTIAAITGSVQPTGSGRASTTAAGAKGGSDTLTFSTNTITLSLTSNWTSPTFSGAETGATYTLFIEQGGVGGFTITWPAAVKWGAVGAPTLSSTAGQKDMIVLYYDGTNYFGIQAMTEIA